jgi:hypothetical protein
MKKSLEERFIDFAKNLDGAESIDGLKLTPGQANAEKADFFFNNRKVICELKSLKKDMQGKIDNILLPHQDRPEWPVFYGEWELSKVLANLPNGEQIHKKNFDAVTSAIKNLMKKANRQIKAPKVTFDTRDAKGLLVILNDMVEILSPDVIAYKVWESLQKRPTEGEVRFREIAAIWIINETHFTQLTPFLEAVPSIIIINNYVEEPTDLNLFVDSLQAKLAAYNKLPLIEMKKAFLRDFKFEKISTITSEQKSAMKRSDLWRLQYKQYPYLRLLNKDELLDFGKEVLKELIPQFLKGTPKKSRDEIGKVIEKWTHFLEEMNIRGIDMRKLTSRFNSEGDFQTS